MYFLFINITHTFCRQLKNMPQTAIKLSAMGLSKNDGLSDFEMKSGSFKNLLDEIIDKGVVEDVVPEAIAQFEDHNYEIIISSDFIIGYVAGIQFYLE